MSCPVVPPLRAAVLSSRRKPDLGLDLGLFASTRWHLTQEASKIGLMSLLKSTLAASSARSVGTFHGPTHPPMAAPTITARHHFQLILLLSSLVAFSFLK